jgi:RHS repeat-associated protein
LPDHVTALLDYQEPLRERIAAMRARMHRGDSAGAVPSPAPSAAASAGTTGIGGTVLRLNDQPLADVTVSIGDRAARTDASGRFTLTGIPPGQHELIVDGTSAGGPGREYLQFALGVDVRPGRLTELPHALYVPRLRPADWVELASPTVAETVVTHPHVPGLEVHIPPGTVFRDRRGKIVRRIALVPVPLDRAPYPTPAEFPIYFMLHPGGAMVQGLSASAAAGIRILYPNSTQDPPATAHDFWVYNPRGRGWMVYGTGHVSPDGLRIAPDPGVGLHEHMGAGHSLPGGPPPPPDAPPPGGCGGQAGDPVDCATGLFLHTRSDVYLADDVPIEMVRTYRPGDPVVRHFGKGTNHTYGLYLRNPDAPTSRERIELILPDGSRIEFQRTGGTSLHGNYVWEHKATPTRFFGAQLTAPTVGVEELWHLRLQDGSVYKFHSGGGGGGLAQMVDRDGNRLFFIRQGGVWRIATQNGRYIDLSRDTAGRITQIKDLIGRVWKYEYNAAGYLGKATYPDNTFEEYTYDAAGRMLMVRDRRGTLMVTNAYDAVGRVKKQTLADAGSFSFAYATGANGSIVRTEVTDPRGSVRRLQFGDGGYLTRQTFALGQPEQQTIVYERNAAHFVTRRTDGLGRATAYQYDQRGNTTQVTRLSGTPAAVSWTFTYEPIFNHLRTVTDPLDHTTTFTYDPEGHLTRITDPLSHKTTFTYDGAGRPRTASRHVGTQTLTTTFGYDGPDLVAVKDPLGRVMSLVPDALGRTVTVKDPLGRVTRTTYDTLDRITAVTDPQGRTVTYRYDGNGNLVSVTDPKGHVTRFAYDPRNRVQRKTDALGKSESYRYDAAGNLLRVTDRRGQISGFAHDLLNRRIRAGFGASSPTAPTFTSTIRYTYDKASRLIAIQDSRAGTITRTYDDRFDALVRERSPQGTVAYTFYANGLRKTLTPSNGTTIAYAYDAANRLTALTQAAGTGSGAVPATPQTVVLRYDSANRQTAVQLPNGMTLRYAYDDASQLQSITYHKADGTVLGDLQYTYDQAGQRTAVDGRFARTGRPRAFANARYDANNRLTHLDGVAYSYDANGNLTGDGAHTYTWNARNQLVAITGRESARFAYDALGRRRQATINGRATTTLYDGWNPIQLQNGATVVENRLMGLTLDAHYARTRNGIVESYLPDALGSTLELRDAAEDLTVRYTYDPHGKTTASDSSTNVVQYTGREHDLGDLYYYRYRYYKPSIGRFMSEDPLEFAGGESNFYVYARNDPVNLVDPTGKVPILDLARIFVFWFCLQFPEKCKGSPAPQPKYPPPEPTRPPIERPSKPPLKPPLPGGGTCISVIIFLNLVPPDLFCPEDGCPNRPPYPGIY